MDGQYLKRNNIPKRLKDCHIVNSYINIYFVSNYNSSFVTNELIEKLSAKFKGDEFKRIPMDTVINASDNPKYFYQNSQIKLKVEDNIVSFNCNIKYPGWETYYPYIQEVLYALQIIDNGIKFPNAEVEYMSAFLDVEIFQKLEGTVKLDNIPNFDNIKLEFSCEFQGDNLSAGRASVNTRIQNNVPIGKGRKASLFTIQVQHKNNNRIVETLLQDIQILHKAEKDLFFNLISNKYIEELGPTYE